MNAEQQARLAAIAARANGQPPQPTINDYLEQQPIGAIRLHNITKVFAKPASPLERTDHDTVYAEIELHLITLGDTDRQVLGWSIEAAEAVIADLTAAITRARAKREPAPAEDAA